MAVLCLVHLEHARLGCYVYGWLSLHSLPGRSSQSKLPQRSVGRGGSPGSAQARRASPCAGVCGAPASEGASVFQAAAITSDILEALGRDGHFTLFAPTNEAFERLPRGVLERIMGDKVASEGRRTASRVRSFPDFRRKSGLCYRLAQAKTKAFLSWAIKILKRRVLERMCRVIK